MNTKYNFPPVPMATPAVPQDSQPCESAKSYVTMLMLAFLIGLIALRGDGWGDRVSFRSQVVLLPFTFCFLLACVILYKPDLLTAHFPMAPLMSRLPLWRHAFAIACIFQLAGFVLFLIEAKYYRAFGYQLHGLLTLGVFGAMSIMLLTSLLQRELKARYLLLAVLGAYTAVYILSIYSFPINVRRSDLLPVIAAGNDSLLAGMNPYRVYTFPNETDLLTYLPGTWLPFLPFRMLGVDLRFANIIFTMAAVLCIYFAADTRYRREVVGLIALLLMCPYLQYRHEIYIQPHWLSLAVCFVLLQRQRALAAAVAFGWSMATSQFSWILLPLFLLYVFRRSGMASSAVAAIIASFVFAAIVGPFFVWSPHGFVYSVLTHWTELYAVNAGPMNLSYWMTRFLPISFLQPIQAFVVGLILLHCALREDFTSLADCFQWMSISLLSFILLNRLVWEYFYLSLLLVMILSVVARNRWLRVLY